MDYPIVPPFDRLLHVRLLKVTSLLTNPRVGSTAITVSPKSSGVYYVRSSSQSHVRQRFRSRWGHDKFPGGWSARHLECALSCSSDCNCSSMILLISCSRFSSKSVCCDTWRLRTRVRVKVQVPLSGIPGLSGVALARLLTPALFRKSRFRDDHG